MCRAGMACAILVRVRTGAGATIAQQELAFGMDRLTSDGEIYARLKAGDMSACRECVQQHSDELFRLANRMLQDEQAAEDVVQDTFLNAFKGLEHFDGRSTLGTWLFRITYNNALMRLRARKPVETLDGDTDLDEKTLTLAVPWREMPEAVVAQGETAAQLQAAIDALPAGLRAVFQLRDVEERSTAETAEILDLTESAVKVRLHRARMLLRSRLSGYFGERVESPPMTMSCEQLMPYLSEYIDNAVDEPLATAARDHIAQCPHCHIMLDTTQRTITLMRQNKAQVIPAADRAELYQEIQKAFAARRKQSNKTKPAA